MWKKQLLTFARVWKLTFSIMKLSISTFIYVYTSNSSSSTPPHTHTHTHTHWFYLYSTGIEPRALGLLSQHYQLSHNPSPVFLMDYSLNSDILIWQPVLKSSICHSWIKLSIKASTWGIWFPILPLLVYESLPVRYLRQDFWVFFQGRISLYSHGCLRIHSVDQSGYINSDWAVFAAQELGLKTCSTTPTRSFYFIYIYIFFLR